MKALAAGAAVLTIAVASAQGATPARPSLRLMHTVPIRLFGEHFHPRERVKVTVVLSGARSAYTVRAGATGAFRVALGEHSFDPCNDSLSAHAIGSDGDEASLKIVPRECPPAP